MDNKIPFNTYMQYAIDEASLAINEVPVGAVVVKNNKIIAKGSNKMITKRDPTAHAEIEAIRNACLALGEYRLEDCSIYVTLEPCPMCAFAISLARIKSIYIGAEDQKYGAILNNIKIYNGNFTNHKPQVYDCIMKEECELLLAKFFSNKRK